MMSSTGGWPHVEDPAAWGQFLGWSVPWGCCAPRQLHSEALSLQAIVFDGLLAVLNPNGFTTGWWWVVTTWRKTPRKPERERCPLGGWSCSCESPVLLSAWVIRNDRLGNVGIKLTCELCQKPQPNQNQSTSAGFGSCFFSFCFVGFLHWTETFSVQHVFVCWPYGNSVAVSHVCVFA